MEELEELVVLKSIYPELVSISDRTGYLDVPVRLDSAIQLVPTATAYEQHNTVSNLPSIRFTFTLPDDYPEEAPPTVILETSPSWLPAVVKQDLEAASPARKLFFASYSISKMSHALHSGCRNSRSSLS
jgi:hypothetical protein